MSTPRRTLRLAPLVALLLLGSCASNRWNGRVQQHGSVDEVMRGDTRGRVRLSSAARENRWGLGLLEGAAGEVVVADGYVWVGEGLSPRDARTRGGFARGERAGWMALARVPRWRDHVVTAGLDLEQLAGLVAELARAEGWDPSRPLPFAVVGTLSDVALHVVRGACPHAGALGPEREPFAARFGTAHGTIVGVYAPGAQGKLVHHGQALHAHVLLRQPSTLAAHLDSAWIQPGALVRVPRR